MPKPYDKIVEKKITALVIENPDLREMDGEDLRVILNAVHYWEEAQKVIRRLRREHEGV